MDMQLPMIMKISRKKTLAVSAFTPLLACILLLTTCSKKTGGNEPEPSGFDKTAMLIFYADSLIIPAYAGMQAQIDLLEISATIFLETPTVGNQQTLKTAFTNAYLQFERISVNQLGPAEKALLNNFLNTFPADIPSIENNISWL